MHAHYRFKLEQESFPVETAWARDAIEPYERKPISIASADGRAFWQEMLDISPSFATHVEPLGFIDWLIEHAPSAYFVEEWYEMGCPGGHDRVRFWLEIPDTAEAMHFTLKWKPPKD